MQNLNEPCPRCYGNGFITERECNHAGHYVTVTSTCPRCLGTGVKSPVVIPKENLK